MRKTLLEISPKNWRERDEMGVKFFGIGLILCCSSALVWAGDADKSSSGSVTDLLAPAINFLIFVGILYWALKDKFVSHFVNLERSVVEIYGQAQSKKRESTEKLKEQEGKINELQLERERIKQEADDRAKRFAKEYEVKTEQRIVKWRESAEAGLEADKTFLMGQLQEKLLERVLSESEGSLRKDAALRERAAKNLLQELS